MSAQSSSLFLSKSQFLSYPVAHTGESWPAGGSPGGADSFLHRERSVVGGACITEPPHLHVLEI